MTVHSPAPWVAFVCPRPLPCPGHHRHLTSASPLHRPRHPPTPCTGARAPPRHATRPSFPPLLPCDRIPTGRPSAGLSPTGSIRREHCSRRLLSVPPDG